MANESRNKAFVVDMLWRTSAILFFQAQLTLIWLRMGRIEFRNKWTEGEPMCCCEVLELHQFFVSYSRVVPSNKSL